MGAQIQRFNSINCVPLQGAPDLNFVQSAVHIFASREGALSW